MGHSGAVDSACRVLPIIDEEPESESESEGAPAPGPRKTGVADRKKKAIVSRMRELLRRAAAQSAQSNSKLRSTVATAKKWKRVVSFQNSRIDVAGASKQLDQQRLSSSSLSSSVSSKQSFRSDDVAVAADQSFPSTGSPPCPAFVSRSRSRSDDEMEMEMAAGRMAQWITTDSDFVVLEL